MSKIEPQHLELLRQNYSLWITWRGQMLAERCESPIEFALATALAHYAALHGDLFDIQWSPEPHPSRTFARIVPQHAVERWRVDFWVKFREVERNIVVECDGHDWHERTAEQASKDKARDRYFAERGIPVMRFTGREIWRDPLACADQVVAAIQNIFTDWQIEQLKGDGGDG